MTFRKKLHIRNCFLIQSLKFGAIWLKNEFNIQNFHFSQNLRSFSNVFSILSMIFQCLQRFIWFKGIEQLFLGGVFKGLICHKQYVENIIFKVPKLGYQVNFGSKMDPKLKKMLKLIFIIGFTSLLRIFQVQN